MTEAAHTRLRTSEKTWNSLIFRYDHRKGAEYIVFQNENKLISSARFIAFLLSPFWIFALATVLTLTLNTDTKWWHTFFSSLFPYFYFHTFNYFFQRSWFLFRRFCFDVVSMWVWMHERNKFSRFYCQFHRRNHITSQNGEFSWKWTRILDFNAKFPHKRRRRSTIFFWIIIEKIAISRMWR